MSLGISQEQIEIFVNQLMSWAAGAIPQFISAVILLMAGLWFAGFASRNAKRIMERSGHVDPTISMVLSSVIRYAVIILLIVAVLSQLGVETTSIIAALGAAGLAIGLALQSTLSNVAAGFMLLWLRPFRVGDYIDAEGIAGTVKQIRLFSTELHSWDGIFQFVPNSQLWNSRVTNYSRLPTRLLELKFGISYNDDVSKAREVLEAIVRADERVMGDPEPQIFTYELGDSAVVMSIRVWTQISDYWAVRWALTERGKIKLEEAGISIPFPQRDVHLIGDAGGSRPAA